jgi:hypothetical protein
VSVPLPTARTVNLEAPSAEEVQLLGRGIIAAITPPGGLTELQATLMDATFAAMTGHTPIPPYDPIVPGELAEGLRTRDEAFRTRIVQVMLLGALVLRPIPPEVTDQVVAFARELGVKDDMLEVAQRFARGSLGLASLDFQRNGYTAEWSEERQSVLHTSRPLADAWDLSVQDPDLAARWAALEELAEATLGRRVADFYRARGFAYPGQPGSAPPLLAQHDWVHVLTDYGTTVEFELEVFAFIARANDDPRRSACWRWWSHCSRPATCGPAPACSNRRRDSCRATASRYGSPTPCDEARSRTGPMTSWPSTGSSWRR